MSHARTTALLCACALVANVAADPAPAPPRRMEAKESKIVQENTIVVKRVPNAYFYPFSLWPLPRYPVRDREESEERPNYKTMLKKTQIKHKR